MILMNSDNALWDKYDIKFKPKRKVNNKSSWKFPHIIGSFYSNKMNKRIEYESINEFIFYSILELDKKTVRYYVQPMEIEIKYRDRTGIEKSWIHVPDVLVFRDNMRPSLYQVKDPQSKNTDKFKIINKKCNKYAKENDWDYNVIYPKLLPTGFISNIRFLTGFLKPRKEYVRLIPILIKASKNIKEPTINELVISLSDKIDPFILIPLIYHLIAIGHIFVNIEKEISEFSNISFYEDIDYYKYLKEVINNENK